MKKPSITKDIKKLSKKSKKKMPFKKTPSVVEKEFGKTKKKYY